MTIRYLHYDVFTTTPLAGNALAVFLDGRGLDTARMQRIAREMNFSESTFILPAERGDTDVRMRIFTPGVEMPMAGHPTVGSTFALAESGTIAAGRERFVFGLNVGPTPVDLAWKDGGLDFVWMTQGTPAVGVTIDDPGVVAAALNLDQDAVLTSTPIQEVSCGVPYLIVPLRDIAAVDRAAVDAASLRRPHEATGVDLPLYLFAMTEGESRLLDEVGADAVERRAPTGSRPASPAPAVYARMFAPGLGVAEDPATGSAAGPLGAYLVRHGLVAAADTAPVVITQGVTMGRPSRLYVEVSATAADAISRVRVGGQAVLVGRGELIL